MSLYGITTPVNPITSILWHKKPEAMIFTYACTGQIFSCQAGR